MKTRSKGVLLALIALVIMPLFTLFTIVPFFLEQYGFTPLIPEVYRNTDWHFLIIMGASLPIIIILLSIAWVGFKKYKNPTLNIKEELKKIYRKVPEYIRKLAANE